MTHLKLTAAPTFDAPVEVPQLGGEKVPVRFTFKHRTQDEFRAMMKADEAGDQREDEVVVMEVACGWELAEEFTPENVRTFCQHFTGAGPAIAAAYLKAFAKARLGN
jgi:hypothetical protein